MLGTCYQVRLLKIADRLSTSPSLAKKELPLGKMLPYWTDLGPIDIIYGLPQPHVTFTEILMMR